MGNAEFVEILKPFIFTVLISALLILIVTAAGMWKIFKKAGYEGWECIVPIYNAIIFLRIIGKPWWWIFLLIVPYVSIIFHIWCANMLSKSFGKNEGFTVGLFFLYFIFIPILGFGSAEYEGPYGDPVQFRGYKERNQFDFERNELV